MTTVRFVPSNLDDVLRRAEVFARSIVRQTGRFEATVKRIVIDEYDAAFQGRGRRFRETWRNQAGPVDLQDTGEFRDSFRRSTIFGRSSGQRVEITMASGEYQGQKGTTPISYLAMVRRGTKDGLQVRLSGDYGGVSRRTEQKIFKEFRIFVRDKGRQAGYEVR